MAGAAFREAISHYLRAATTTGAATVFVFRDEMGQVMTYAYAASANVHSSAVKQAAKFGQRLQTQVSPAWTALTQWKEQSTEKMSKILTWTNLVFSEFAARGGHYGEGFGSLPVDFKAIIQLILERMILRRVARTGPQMENVDAPPDVNRNVPESEPVTTSTEPKPVSETKDPAVDQKTVSLFEMDDEYFTDALDTQSEDEQHVLECPVVFELDQEQSNAEW